MIEAPKLTDSHCHLDFPDFEGELDQIIARAAEAGVRRMVTIYTRLRQEPQVAGRSDHLASHALERLGQGRQAHTKPCPRHGLMLPGPGRVAAALALIIGKGLEGGHQQP